MTHETFIDNYNSYLAHKWVSSRDKAKATEQKKREQEYNAQYYKNNREEILANRRRSQARSNLQREHRYMSGEQALSELNKQQQMMAGPYGPKLGDTSKLSDTEKQIREQQIQDIMKKGPLLSRTDAERLWENKQARLNREEAEIAVRNERAKTTGLNQAEMQRSNAMSKKQKDALNRRSESDTKASEAQAAARNPRRQQHSLYNQSSSSANASNAQATSASNRRSTALNRTQTNTLNRRSGSDTSASEAQTAASRNRSAYQQSLTGKINRAVSRASKKVTDTINSVKAAQKKAVDVYNSTAAEINKAKSTVQITLNKYFG